MLPGGVREAQTQVYSSQRFKSHGKQDPQSYPSPHVRSTQRKAYKAPLPLIIPAHSSDFPSPGFWSPPSRPSLTDSGSSGSRAQTSSPPPNK